MRQNKALLTLFLFNSIFVFAGSFLGPLYSIYVEQITHNILLISVLWATFMFIATIGTAIVASFGDKVKEKEYLLLAGYLFRAIGWFSYAFATSFVHLLIIQAILGIGEALGTPAFEVIFASHVDKRISVKEYSIWKVISNFVVASGTLLGGWIVTQWGFIPLFIGMSLLAIIAFVGVLSKPRRLL